MPIIQSSYQAPVFLGGAHSATLIGTLMRTVHFKASQSEDLQLRDSRWVELEWNECKEASNCVLLLHGMESSAHSGSVKQIAKYLRRHGISVCRVSLPGCTVKDFPSQGSYHGGDHKLVEEILSHAIEKHPHNRFWILGLSLGGNMALCHASHPSRLADRIAGYLAFSAPLDLQEGVERIENSALGFYHRYFLRSIKAKIRSKRIVRSVQDSYPLGPVRTLREFDGRYTCSLAGARDAESYYSLASSRYYIESVQKPTLILNALNDPFLGEHSYPFALCTKHPYISLETPKLGGHLGFVSLYSKSYMATRALDFITQHSKE